MYVCMCIRVFMYMDVDMYLTIKQAIRQRTNNYKCQMKKTPKNYKQKEMLPGTTTCRRTTTYEPMFRPRIHKAGMPTDQQIDRSLDRFNKINLTVDNKHAEH